MKKIGLAIILALTWLAASSLFAFARGPVARGENGVETATPIKYLVVIFDENNSFDHYFGTYPYAANPQGEPQFHAAPGTPTVNGLSPILIAHNPNSTAPFRLDRSQAVTCDNINHYTNEQKAYDGGLVDKFPQNTSSTDPGCPAGLAMGYYDGNTVTALWSYARDYAMSDNFFATEFGTTVMGHINLISGNTHQDNVTSIPGKIVNGSIIGNLDPQFDDCSHGAEIAMTGKNVGDLLNAQGVTWGWFYGDFKPVSITNGIAQCTSQYDGHYDPFQYYQSTANPHHLPPSSVAAIGYTDQANHQYDLSDFWDAVAAGNIPSVSFLKAPRNETGHPSGSSPLLEQTFLVDTINRLQKSPEWKQMAIIITYDDSDGWYDHVMPPIVSQSNDPSEDALLGPVGLCGTAPAGADEDRCGYGPRLPFLVISPFAKHNYVSNTVDDQTSVLKFIEDNWDLGRIGGQSFDSQAGSILGMFDFSHPRDQRLLLNPTTGEPLQPASESESHSQGR